MRFDKLIPLSERFIWQELAMLALLACGLVGLLVLAFSQPPAPSPPCEMVINEKIVRGHAHGSMCHAH